MGKVKCVTIILNFNLSLENMREQKCAILKDILNLLLRIYWLNLKNHCQSLKLCLRLLSNSRLSLGVDFVLSLSQQEEQEEQEEQPSPKFIRRGCARRLKFDT